MKQELDLRDPKWRVSYHDFATVMRVLSERIQELERQTESDVETIARLASRLADRSMQARSLAAENDRLAALELQAAETPWPELARILGILDVPHLADIAGPIRRWVDTFGRRPEPKQNAGTE